MTTTNKTAKKIWNTGFKPGRPRAGELRLVSPNAEAQKRYRKKHKEKWNAYNLMMQKEWVAANPERSKEIAKGSRERAKALKAAPKLNLV